MTTETGTKRRWWERLLCWLGLHTDPYINLNANRHGLIWHCHDCDRYWVP